MARQSRRLQRTRTASSHLDRRRFVCVAGTVTLAGCGLLSGDGDDAPPTIDYGETVEGELTENVPTDPSQKRPGAPYRFTGEEGDAAVIELTSDDFAPFVLLTNPYDHLAARADESTQRRSLLETDLVHGGEYTIWAGAQTPSATGSFTLSLSRSGE